MQLSKKPVAKIAAGLIFGGLIGLAVNFVYRQVGVT
jgi:hypothetical protein